MEGSALFPVLGLWLSVVTLALALGLVCFRWGQARERQQQQQPAHHAEQAQSRQPLEPAAADARREQVTRAELERQAWETSHQTALKCAWQSAWQTAQAELLQTTALPMLLAHTGTPGADSAATGSGWVVSQLNPAAAALWPDAHTGQAVDELLTRLPGPSGRADEGMGDGKEAGTAGGTGDELNSGQDASVGGVLAAALPQLAPGAQAAAGGWTLSRLSATELGPDTLLLAASGQGWAASAGQGSAVPSPTPAAAAPVNQTPAPGAQSAQQSPASGTGHAGESENFSFTLSHDLRAPIRVVEGFTRIVKEDYGSLLDRVGNDHLDRVLSAAARMNLMIDALLTLARLSSQPLARQPVNLSQLAQYVVEDLQRQQPERAAQVHIEVGLTAVGDPTLLRLVLENLLGNAWKYSARNASTHIEFKREAVDGRTAFVVRDQGAGFDMRSADRLFGLFQRLHSANDFPGTGVGLASVQRIVRRHGGEIWAAAEPGHGASFHFTLAN